MTVEAKFLNVDIDLFAPAGLKELLEAFGPSVLVLYSGEDFVSFELAGTHESPAALAEDLSALVASLPKEERDIWDSCPRKEFNIGTEFVDGTSATHFELSRETLALVISLGLSVRFTTYHAGDAQARSQ